jgi:hypothetical protein
LEIRGGELDLYPKLNEKKKRVFSLKTARLEVFFIQPPSDSEMGEWIDIITEEFGRKKSPAAGGFNPNIVYEKKTSQEANKKESKEKQQKGMG